MLRQVNYGLKPPKFKAFFQSIRYKKVAKCVSLIFFNDSVNEWLKSKGKLGGQHKIPRLSNTRKHIEEMLAFNDAE